MQESVNYVLSRHEHNLGGKEEINNIMMNWHNNAALASQYIQRFIFIR